MVDADEYRRTVISLFEEALDRIAAEGREPNSWEGDCLSAALRSIAIGNYGLALQLISSTKEGSRAMSPKLATIDQLRCGIANAQGISASSPAPTVRVSLMIGQDMLADIDKWAGSRRLSRSASTRRLIAMGLKVAAE